MKFFTGHDPECVSVNLARAHCHCNVHDRILNWVDTIAVVSTWVQILSYLELGGGILRVFVLVR